MAIRDDLLARITTNLAAHTNFKVSSELPFQTAGQPLYEKNKKTVYVGEEAQEISEFIPVLSSNKVLQTATTVNGYLVTDAKNQPSDIDTVIANILAADAVVSTSFETTAAVDTEITDDMITYTFEYNFLKL